MKYIPNAMIFDIQSRSSWLILNMILENGGSWPKLKTWVKLVPTMKFAPIFMKFGTYNKSNMLIIILIHTSVESAGVIEKMIICSEWLQVAKFDP